MIINPQDEGDSADPDDAETEGVDDLGITRGWLSLRQWAIVQGISYPTARRYAESGKVRAIKVGSVSRVYTDEIIRYRKEGPFKDGH